MNITLILFSINIIAQNTKEIKILNADNTFANNNHHPDYWRLVGNVIFMHNNIIMNCDSAYHYSNEEKMQAFGRITINQGDSITITGENLTYFGDINLANIAGNVALKDNYMTLKTNKISYNLTTNIAYYTNKGIIVNQEKKISSKKGTYNSNYYKFIFKDSVEVIAEDYNILTDTMHYNSKSEITYFYGPSFILSDNKIIYCENGWYNTKTDLAQFKNNAYIKSDEYLLTGDSLFYDKKNGYGKVINNVEVIDSIDNTTVIGGLAEYYENEKHVKITLNPMLQILFNEDTLFMVADKFICNQKVISKNLLAYNNVKFYKTNLQGKCDSLSYNISDSILEMYVNPILWIEGFQITADSLKLLLNNRKLDVLFIKPNPMIIFKEDSINYNQIKGKNMFAYFIDNKLNRIDVKGNGQSILIVEDEEKNDKIGLNYIECTNITLYFKNSTLETVNYQIKPNSITTPYHNVEEKERYLKGFIWREDEQPKNKEDIQIL